MMLLLYPDQPMERGIDALDEMDEQGGWYAEQKLDGWRCEILVGPNGELKFLSRHNKPLAVSTRLAQVIADLRLPPDTQIDGEWMQRRKSLLEIAFPECFYLHDLLMIDGQDIRGAGNWFRRQWLRELLGMKPEELCALRATERLLTADPIHMPDAVSTDFKEFFLQQTSQPHTEGIVLKRIEGISTASSRGCKKTGAWVKVKWRAGSDGQQVKSFAVAEQAKWAAEQATTYSLKKVEQQISSIPSTP